MPRKQVLRVQASQLGFASIDAQSRNIDWGTAFEADGSFDGWHIVYPRVTFGDIAEHAPDLLPTKTLQRHAASHPDKDAPGAMAEAFSEDHEDSRNEWEQGFEPMMNYVWPAFLPHGITEQDLADRLAIFAPNISLIHFGDNSPHCPEEYGYALNGGGMNLADQIAAAYLCAHQIPPTGILSDLAGVPSDYMLARIGGALKAAYRQAADAHRSRAKRLTEESARMFKPKGT